MKNNIEINENRGIPIDEGDYKAVESFFSVVKSVTAPLFPPVAILAQVASAVLSVLFEKKNKDIWGTISVRVEKLIQNNIDKLIYENAQISLEGLNRGIEDYAKYLVEWEKTGKGTTELIARYSALDTNFITSMPEFKNSHHRASLLHFFSNAAYRHIALLSNTLSNHDKLNQLNENRYEFNKMMGDKNALKKKLIEKINEYSSYISEEYSKEFNNLLNKNNWIDLNSFRNLCGTAVFPYAMMLETFNPDIYHPLKKINSIGSLRVFQDVIMTKSDIFDNLISNVRHFDEEHNSDYIVGSLIKIDFTSISDNWPGGTGWSLKGAKVDGLVTTSNRIVPIGPANPFGPTNPYFFNIENSPPTIKSNMVKTTVDFKKNVPVTKATGKIFNYPRKNCEPQTPTMICARIAYIIDSLTLANNDDVIETMRFSNPLGEMGFPNEKSKTSFVSGLIENKNAPIETKPNLMFIKLVNDPSLKGEYPDEYSVINIFGWNSGYQRDLLPKSKATKIDDMEMQQYYAISALESILKNSLKVIKNVSYSQGSLIYLKSGQDIEFHLTKDLSDPDRGLKWYCNGNYDVRVWYRKTKEVKLTVGIYSYISKGDYPDPNATINLHHTESKEENAGPNASCTYSDMTFISGSSIKLTNVNLHNNMIIYVSNHSESGIIIDRLELFPSNLKDAYV